MIHFNVTRNTKMVWSIWCYAASVLSVSGGCSGCAEMGLQDKVGPAHHSVVYSKTSTHPCCTVFALALSGGELSPHAAVVTALGVSLSVWQLVQFLPRIDKGWLSLILFFNTMFVCPLGINGKTTKSFCIFYFLLLQVVYLWFRIIEVSKKKST